MLSVDSEKISSVDSAVDSVVDSTVNLVESAVFSVSVCIDLDK